MTDAEFLTFIYNRLKNIHGEDEFYDYMLRFKGYINTLDKNQKTDWEYDYINLCQCLN